MGVVIVVAFGTAVALVSSSHNESDAGQSQAWDGSEPNEN